MSSFGCGKCDKLFETEHEQLAHQDEEHPSPIHYREWLRARAPFSPLVDWSGEGKVILDWSVEGDP